MTHADVLKALFPLPLGDNHAADCDLEGDWLDAADARITELAAEVFPDTAVELIADWERLCGVDPGFEPGDIAARRNAVLTKLRATGGQSRAYFIALAASLGYDGVTIFEPKPAYCGVAECGDTIYAADVVFCWRVDGIGLPAAAYARCGVAECGDRLCEFAAFDSLAFFNLLKPAHTAVYFGE